MVSSFSKITECPIVELQEDIASYLIDYFSLLARVTCDEKLSLPSEMTEVSLRSILTAVGLIYQRYSSKNHNTNRKEEICRELVGLVTEHYTEERRAQFYADKLGISLQHLSTTVKQVTGRNVLDVIAYVVIIDAKAKLKSSNMTIQEIAYSLNFPSASYLLKYFPQCFVLWKIFQEICRHESAGIQKQLTTFSGKDIQNPFLPQRAESNTEQTSNYG